MTSSHTDKERVRKATVDLVRKPHHRNDDEDIHPARLDPAEARLERAIEDEVRSGKQPIEPTSKRPPESS